MKVDKHDIELRISVIEEMFGAYKDAVSPYLSHEDEADALAEGIEAGLADLLVAKRRFVADTENGRGWIDDDPYAPEED